MHRLKIPKASGGIGGRRERFKGTRLVGTGRPSGCGPCRLIIKTKPLQRPDNKTAAAQFLFDGWVTLDASPSPDNFTVYSDKRRKGLGPVERLAGLCQKLNSGHVGDVIFACHASPKFLTMLAKRPRRLQPS